MRSKVRGFYGINNDGLLLREMGRSTRDQKIFTATTSNQRSVYWLLQTSSSNHRSRQASTPTDVALRNNVVAAGDTRAVNAHRHRESTIITGEEARRRTTHATLPPTTATTTPRGKSFAWTTTGNRTRTFSSTRPTTWPRLTSHLTPTSVVRRARMSETSGAAAWTGTTEADGAAEAGQWGWRKTTTRSAWRRAHRHVTRCPTEARRFWRARCWRRSRGDRGWGPPSRQQRAIWRGQTRRAPLSATGTQIKAQHVNEVSLCV